jgi:hypothetical protein
MFKVTMLSTLAAALCAVSAEVAASATPVAKLDAGVVQGEIQQDVLDGKLPRLPFTGLEFAQLRHSVRRVRSLSCSTTLGRA